MRHEANATTMIGPAQASMNDNIIIITMVICIENAIMPIHSSNCGYNIKLLTITKRRNYIGPIEVEIFPAAESPHIPWIRALLIR